MKRFAPFALLMLCMSVSSQTAIAASYSIASMNITGGGVLVDGFPVPFIPFYYFGPNTNLVGGYIGNTGADRAQTDYDPAGIATLDWIGIPFSLYTANANYGDVYTPAGTFTGGPVPSGYLDDVNHTITMYLSSLFGNWGDADYITGTGRNDGVTSAMATGTWDPVSHAYTLHWDSRTLGPECPGPGGCVSHATFTGTAIPGDEVVVVDADGDGILDVSDNCPAQPNPLQEDNDGDSIGDACDPDDDNDGVADAADNCPFVVNADQADLDHDGVGDACDGDTDGDGVVDEADNCPLNPNPLQEDNDADNAGDACDADDDNDGVPDDSDNCPTLANADQADLDGDSLGDACDADDDGDGYDDTIDNCPLETNPGQDDADQDGAGDACDGDDDNDNIADGADNCPLMFNPDQADTDGDGVGDVCDGDLDGDGIDNAADNCPALANASQMDYDGDGLGDVCDPDADDDGVANDDDLCAQTSAGSQIDPGNGCSLAQLVPCDHPMGASEPWRNHGQYVAVYTNTARHFMELGLFAPSTYSEAIAAAAVSHCGMK